MTSQDSIATRSALGLAALASVLTNVGATFLFALFMGPSDHSLIPLLEFTMILGMGTLATALLLGLRGHRRCAGGVVLGLIAAVIGYGMYLAALLSQLS